jgi:hypothetical protein
MRDKYADSNPEKLQFKRCESFLKLFNTGNFGPVILDDISKPYRKFEFRDSHFVKKTNYGGYSKRDGFDDDDEHDGRRGRRQGREYDDDTKDEFHEDDFDF